MQNKTASIIILLACSFALAPVPAEADQKTYRLTTRGSGYERGLQQGEQLRKVIRESIASDVRAPARRIAESPATVAHFLRRLRALPSGRELCDEMQGIAEASGVPFVQIVALNLCFRAQKLGSCSTACLPQTADGPILINTTDQTANWRGKEEPCVLHEAYPSAGRAMIFDSVPGTVWAWRGINQDGLALGATSGSGSGLFGFNPDGLDAGVAMRVALESNDDTAAAVKFLESQREVSKPANISVLDRSGDAAIVEYAYCSVAVRRAEDRRPIWATNTFHFREKTPETVANPSSYRGNSDARFLRFGKLLSSAKIADLALAKCIIYDRNEGQIGQICQDNSDMITASANIWMCAEPGVYYYPGRPSDTQPWRLRIQPEKKPAAGAPAPVNPSVSDLLSLPEPGKAK